MFQRAHQFLAIGLTITLSGSMARAASPGAEPKQDTIKVIGTLDIHASNIRQIQLGERQGKNVVYLQDRDKCAMRIIDVTDAAHPIVEKVVTMPNGFASVEAVAGDAVLLADRSDPAPGDGESMAIVNLGHSNDPHRVKRTFKNVSAIATDDQRGLIYLVDQDGLKILSRNFSPDPQLESENAWRFAP